MRYLVDTHIFLWWLNGDKRLEGSVVEAIKDRNNQIFVSVACGWEISIKHRKGKLPLKTTLKKCFELSSFEILNINMSHILQLDKLPLRHNDPFDRIIIAQSQVENLTLITSDQKIWKYSVDILKC